MTLALTCLLAYLAGSVPFGYLIARRRGVDIRAAGSRNIGATNVARQLGGKAGAVVLALDFAKGAAPALLALRFGGAGLAVAAGASALLGHIFPVWLRLRGGKGVATGAGVVTVLLPLPAGIALLTWLAVLSATRYVALASVLAAGAIAAARLVLSAAPWREGERILTLFSLAAFALVAVRHAGNMARLACGQEPQVTESPAMRGLGKVIHVLALGLWFGSNVFFTFVAAVLIFKTWEAIGAAPLNERPTWLPVGAGFNKEAGTRVAGATVAPIFPFFFVIQGACALLGLITALGFARAEPARRVHRARFWLILLAAITVAAGWPLAQRVGELRSQRYDPEPSISLPARAEFSRLHTASLFLNFGTVALVTAAMALSAFLPNGAVREVANREPGVGI